MTDPELDSLVQHLQQTLQAFPELKTIVLFGSLATGRTHSDSDLDLAVDAGAPLDEILRIKLIEALALAMGRPVDLVDLREVGEPLLDQIISNGVRIRGSNNDWARLIYRNIMENEDFVPLQKRILETRRNTWINS